MGGVGTEGEFSDARGLDSSVSGARSVGGSGEMRLV